jgi:hypothetical protein
MARKKITGNSSCSCVICEDPDNCFEGKKHPCDFFVSGGVYCKYARFVHVENFKLMACDNNNAILCMVEESR